jgi:tricorn protease
MQSTGHFSPDGKWVAFTGARGGSNAREIVVVPVTADGTVPAARTVEITADDFVNKEPAWSPDGRRIYFVSNRDGSDCVWARNVDPASARPLGAAFPVAHFHRAARVIRGPSVYFGTIGLSVARNFLVLTVTDTKDNIWGRTTLP